MKQSKTALVLVSILVMLSVWGFIAVYRNGYVPSGLDLLIFVLIIVSGVYAFMTHLKRHRELVAGYPAEDEMSRLIKYKAGHHAFMASMYIWLAIFLFKESFPDIETLLGGGILLSGVTAMAIRAYLTRHFDENPD